MNGRYVGKRNSYNNQEITKCKYCGSEVLIMKHLNLSNNRWEYIGTPICDYCRYKKIEA